MIFKRGTQYLSGRYTWCNIPHIFNVWQFGDLLDLFGKWKDRPTEVAQVVGHCIDLDAVEWSRL